MLPLAPLCSLAACIIISCVCVCISLWRCANAKNEMFRHQILAFSSWRKTEKNERTHKKNETRDIRDPCAVWKHILSAVMCTLCMVYTHT